MKPWHDDDRFWETMAGKMFTRERWEAAGVEVDSIITLLDMRPEAEILDLCCGPGRHSLEFARRGYKVVGVDRTGRYLEEAKKRAKDQKLSIEFLKADMREYREQERYDVVLNLFTSFGYFEDPEEDSKVLSNIHASLKEGGKAVIELFGKEILARVYRDRDWYEEDGVIYLEERRLDNDWGTIHNRWVMIVGKRRREFHFSHRMYSGRELMLQLEAAGFREIKLFGSLQGIPYDNHAKRLVAVARR